MSIRSHVAALFLFVIACKPQSTPHPAAKSGQPQVKATVLTISTVLHPDARTFTHTLAIAGSRARSSDELDRWRLFDLAKNEVTFVDDVARTYRRVPLQSLIADRKAAAAQPLPEGLPRAELEQTKANRTIQGVTTTQSIVRMGSYQRQLWIGSHPLIPAGLFAMMEASRPITTPVEGVMRAVDDALLDVQGFPLAEHAELPYGHKKMVLDSNVVKIEQTNVPASWLNVRTDYRDVSQPEQPVGKGGGTR